MKTAKTLFCTTLFFLTIISYGQENTSLKKTKFKYGGYVKLDVLSSWYQNGDVSNTSPQRDIVLPGAIPVGEEDRNQMFDMHLKESRFNFDVNTTINKQNIHAYLEFDFLLSAQGNERVSNSFSPRIRHFYFEWNRLLIGQSWTTFMIVIIPDDIEFSGGLEGLVFNRQPQIRYRAGSWVFALENPQTTYSLYQQNEIHVSGKEFIPDFVVRKNFIGRWGTWSIAGLTRGLSMKDSLNVNHKALGYGFTTGGKILVGKRGDDFRMQFTYGSGLGRYINAAFISSSILDDQSNLQANASINGYVAYNHYWIPHKLSSSIHAGYFQTYYNEAIVGEELNNTAFSASLNLKYDPVPQIRFGIEYMICGRELFNGTNGLMHRLQIAAKYRFGYTDVSTIEK